MITKHNVFNKKLNIYEYLEQLQVEYVSIDLRRRLYNREHDRNYWAKMGEYKKIKIQEIANKNQLPTIFNDQDVFRKTEEKVYVGKSFPMFFYKNIETENRLKPWDHFHYYRINSPFRVELFGQQLIAEIKEYKLFESTAKFKILATDEIIEINLENAFRIL